MYFKSLFIDTKGSEAYNMGYNIGTLIGENIYLLMGLLIGITVAFIMRKNLKAKP